MWVMVEITTGVLQLGIVEQPTILRLRRGFEQTVHFCRAGIAPGLESDIQGRDVDRGHADRLGLDAPGQLRQQPPYTAGPTGGHRDPRLEGRARPPQTRAVVRRAP